jgi:hypothetical protein
LPKGTIIKTSLYRIKDDGTIEQQYAKENPNAVSFVVDHIKVVKTCTGRSFIVVTTTIKQNPVYDGDNFFSFHIDHVDKILFTGKKMDIRYDSEEKITDSDVERYRYKTKVNGVIVYQGYVLKFLLNKKLNKLQPYNQFDLHKCVEAAIKDGIFIGAVKSMRSNVSNSCRAVRKHKLFTVNKKRLDKWVKQNINRFILTQAEIQRREEEATAFMYKDLENGFDREYDNSWVADEKPDQELKPVEDEEPRFEEYELLSPEEKAVHDGFYGGST